MVIESKENKKIKYINKLRTSKFMNEESKFIVEGKHLVNEAYNAGVLLETISTDEQDYNVPNVLITKNIMDYISKLPSSSNVIGICKFIEEKAIGKKIIILDNVQDPGNVGTIIRSANAFGFDTIVLSENSVNKYNEKLIRASQGMLFNSNVIIKNLSEFIEKLKDQNYKICVTDVNDGKNVSDIKNVEKLAIIMGNEGQGVSSKIKEYSDVNLYIPMNDTCESLNVAVASSIIMYELYKED